MVRITVPLLGTGGTRSTMRARTLILLAVLMATVMLSAGLLVRCRLKPGVERRAAGIEEAPNAVAQPGLRGYYGPDGVLIETITAKPPGGRERACEGET